MCLLCLIVFEEKRQEMMKNQNVIYIYLLQQWVIASCLVVKLKSMQGKKNSRKRKKIVELSIIKLDKKSMEISLHKLK